MKIVSEIGRQSMQYYTSCCVCRESALFELHVPIRKWVWLNLAFYF